MNSNKSEGSGELPAGYRLVKDRCVGEYVTPAGYRLEVARSRGRPIRRVPGVGGRDFLTKMREMTAKMNRIDAMEAGGVGGFVKWGMTGKAPKMLADLIRKRKRWAFVVSAGGYIRLAEKARPMEDLWDWKPGDWCYDEVRSPIPGFATTDFEGSTIRVRLPAMSMELTGDWIPGETMPPEDPVRLAAIEAIRAVYAAQSGVKPDGLDKWLANAPTVELVKWVQENVPFADASDGADGTNNETDGKEG